MKVKKPPNPVQIEDFIVSLNRIIIDDPFDNTITSLVYISKSTLELLSELLRAKELKEE